MPGGGHRLTYARVDVIPGPDGPVLLELEATDCFLFLAFASDESRLRLGQHLLGSISRAEGQAPGQRGVAALGRKAGPWAQTMRVARSSTRSRCSRSWSRSRE